MTRCVALLRGINVGGRNKLPMADLRALMAELGLTDVKTLLQSGNVLFDTDRAPDELVDLGAELSAAIETAHGFTPHVLLLTGESFAEAMKTSPYADIDDPATVHLFFCDGDPVAHANEALEALRAETERFVLTDRVVHLHAPDGVARSKFLAKAEQALGVPTTARNRRTAQRIVAAL